MAPEYLCLNLTNLRYPVLIAEVLESFFFNVLYTSAWFLSKYSLQIYRARRNEFTGCFACFASMIAICSEEICFWYSHDIRLWNFTHRYKLYQYASYVSLSYLNGRCDGGCTYFPFILQYDYSYHAF